MSGDAKIRIEPKELEIIQDPTPFLMRQEVMPKLTALLAQWMETLKGLPEYQSFPFPEGTDSTIGNIARGERLQGCPYLIADLPRHFGPKGHFALRTLFWWGHGFTFFWHVSGAYLLPFGQRLIDNLGSFPSNARISVSGNEWEHDQETDNYEVIDLGKTDTYLQLAQESNFIKLALTWPLDEWESLEEAEKSFALAGLKAMRG